VLSGPPVPPPAPTAEDIVASIDGVLSAAGRYRITERCILPGHEYDHMIGDATSELTAGTGVHDDFYPGSVARRCSPRPTICCRIIPRATED
jgi:hypothetical protein